MRQYPISYLANSLIRVFNNLDVVSHQFFPEGVLPLKLILPPPALVQTRKFKV